MNRETVLEVLRALARCDDRVIRDHARGILVRLALADDGEIAGIELL